MVSNKHEKEDLKNLHDDALREIVASCYIIPQYFKSDSFDASTSPLLSICVSDDVPLNHAMEIHFNFMPM